MISSYLCSQMKRFNRPLAPLLPPAISLAAGIVAGTKLSVAWPWLAGAVVVALLAWRWPRVQSVCLWLCFLMLGMVIAPKEEEPAPDGIWLEAVVASVPTEKPKTMMAELLIAPKGERRRCYFSKDERSQRLSVGTNLLVRIHDGQFINYRDWQPGGEAFNKISSVQRLRLRALQWRGRAMNRLGLHPRSAGEERDAEAVLAAMVLGDKSALTRELRQSYAQTGASHILALSGLHLSIIYLLLTRLMQGRRRFWLSQVLTVLGIWAFALLTGLSVSVVRAAIMLTVYALFELGGRRHAPLGVLSFTAIVMMLADSRTVFDVGFQLSFMSMVSILLFVPLFERPLSDKWMARHRMVHWFISLLTVSVAAQLGTAPLVAYYFGQFPTWFLLTNIIVVPLAMLILYGAVIALLIPQAGGIIVFLAKLLNTAIDQLSQLPLATISGLRPSVLQVVMIYVVIAVFYQIGLLWNWRKTTQD